MSRFIDLHNPDTPNLLSEDLLRAALLANARLACDDHRGRVQGDPLFEEVVERRQRFRGYSGCADLIHWSLRRAGLRDESILNREDDDGYIPWKPSINVSRLVFATRGAFKWWHRSKPFAPKPGDMGLIGENGQEHVFIVSEVTDNVLRSYDYGQFFNGKHGGRGVTRSVLVEPGERIRVFTTTLPGRPWIGHLDVFELLEPYFLRGELEPAEVPDSFELGHESPQRPPHNPLLTTREIQQALLALGFSPGLIDGVNGPKTRAAIRDFQRSHGLVADGIVGRFTRAKLQELLST